MLNYYNRIVGLMLVKKLQTSKKGTFESRSVRAIKR